MLWRHRFRFLSALLLACALIATGLIDTPLKVSYQAASASNSSHQLVSKTFQTKKWLREHDRLRRISGGVTPSIFECGASSCWEIRNIQKDGRPWHRVKDGGSAFGTGGMTISVGTTKSVANGYHSDFSISAGNVSAKVGFNVAMTWSTTISGSIRVPQGTCMQLNSYKVYQDYKGDAYRKEPLWSHYDYVGKIRFWRFVGIGFKTFEVPCS